MAWPTDVLGIVVEIYVNGAWVDITSDVRRRDGAGISGSDGTQGTTQRRGSPSTVTMELNNRDGQYSPRNPASPYYGLLTINTEMRIRLEGIYQFWGEVSSGWPTEWTAGAPGAGDAWVPLQASGRQARINADTTPLPGALYELLSDNADYYWPLTDPSSASAAAPAPPMTGSLVLDPPSLHPWGGGELPRFSSASGPPSSPSTPDFANRGALTAALSDGVSSSSFYVAVWFKLDSGETSGFGAMSLYQLGLDGVAGNVTGTDAILYAGLGSGTPGINRIGLSIAMFTGLPRATGNRSADMTLNILSTPCTQDDWHLLRVTYEESGGAITIKAYLDGTLLGTDVGSAAGYFFSALTEFTLGANDTAGVHTTAWTSNTGVGLASLSHAAIRVGSVTDPGIHDAGTGYPGETAADRIDRLLTDAGVGFELVGTAADTATMAAQTYGGTLSSVLDECAVTDGGLLTDSRDMLGMRYVTRVELYNRAADLALDYTLKAEVMPGLKTDESTQTIVNDLTATSPVGDVRAQQLTGSRNVTEPNAGTGGVGRYPGRLGTSLDTSDQVRDAAEWALRLATTDVPRFTSIPVNLLALAAAGKTTLWQDAAQVEPGGVITVTNTPIWIPDDVAVFAVGRSWTAANKEWSITYNTVDATAWQNLGVLEDSVLGRADSEDSFLHSAASSSTTQILVANTGEEHIPTLWSGTDVPYDIRIDDEIMTVTSLSTVTVAYTATGTAAYADNASVTPGLPGGATTGGHLMILFAYARSASTVANVPAGWTFLAGIPGSNGFVACKVHTGSESAPTVTFTGGSAGDTHGAVIASFTGLQKRQATSDLRGVGTVGYDASFGTSQHIDVPGIGATRDNVAAMRFGAKADDWTSVTGLGGATEIYDGSSTLGSDLGLVWDFQTIATRAAIAAATFTVNGGASAAWDSCIMLIDGNVQRLVVTRGVRGTTAALHVVGSQVRLADPMVLGR